MIGPDDSQWALSNCHGQRDCHSSRAWTCFGVKPTLASSELSLKDRALYYGHGWWIDLGGNSWDRPSIQAPHRCFAARSYRLPLIPHCQLGRLHSLLNRFCLPSDGAEHGYVCQRQSHLIARSSSNQHNSACSRLVFWIVYGTIKLILTSYPMKKSFILALI